MAINPSVAFPGRITAPDASYPYGSSKDETSSGAGDGTPYKKLRADDILGFQQALLAEAAIVPSGNADTALSSQYKDALKVVLGGAGLYQTDINYPADSYTKGSDGNIYRAVAANGPATSIVSPIGNPGVWFNVSSISRIQPFDAEVVGGELVVTLGPTTNDFRSNTLNDGTVTSVTNASQLSLAVPDGATLGTVNGVEGEAIVVEINNAGTPELAIVNIAGGNDLSERGVISTTAIDATADLDNVFYSDTARTDVAYRVVGSVVLTQAVAGTWITDPSNVQGYGGNQDIGPSNAISAAKGWVNFNGEGTVAIGDSFNVSSVTDNGVGLYAINFTNAISIVGCAVAGGDAATINQHARHCVMLDASTAEIKTFTNGAAYDATVNNVAVF